MIEAEALDLAYGETTIVHGADLTVRAGAVTVLVGENGCGKSTLVRGLARLLEPRNGRVVIDGHDARELSPRDLARTRSFLPQHPLVPEAMTVADLVAQGRAPYSRAWSRRLSATDTAAVEKAMHATSTLELASRRVDRLSGGQRQRVWLAMALAQEAGVLLLDEPTSFLDVAHQLDVLDLVRHTVRERGVTAVMVLHDLTMAARYADDVVAMRHGRIVASGAPSEVLRADVIGEVFDVDAAILEDPVSGSPVVVPLGRRTHESAPTG